ncbi:MAG: helix-turn-helix domain-containing protein [Rhodobacteraceae bacterium]|nr:helix-turn-helix domain-containing protein [Paracoccaceae bacterium]
MDDAHQDWFGPETATFGDRLAGARDAAGMTQAQLARRIGVKKATLVGWEEDLSEPRANRLSMLAGVLNVSIMWLLTGEGDGAALPEEEPDMPEGMDTILAELRQLRAELRGVTDRAARTEKKLRKLMEGSA